MIITKEWLEQEIAECQREMGNAQNFLIRAEAALNVHRMLLAKLQEPEPEIKEESNVSNLYAP
jgi:hypothetical protein